MKTIIILIIFLIANISWASDYIYDNKGNLISVIRSSNNPNNDAYRNELNKIKTLPNGKRISGWTSVGATMGSGSNRRNSSKLENTLTVGIGRHKTKTKKVDGVNYSVVEKSRKNDLRKKKNQVRFHTNKTKKEDGIDYSIVEEMRKRDFFNNKK